jgi:uracil-DNA glycosylase
MTPWQKHIEIWTACTRCPLCNQRDKICLGRGSLPCDVLFIGEAPGTSENDLGYPFAGPAGHLLNEWVEFALQGIDPAPRCSFTNLVACFPAEAKATGDHQPAPEEIKACEPRLKEFIGLCKPRLKLVVCVGALADKHIPKKANALGIPVEVKIINITHPSAVLRANVAQKDMMAQMARVTLATAIQEMTE